LTSLSRELSVLLGAYALGSIPWSFLVARLWGVADVRAVGSGNVGATNVMRSAGRLPGLLALLLDAGKGALAVALAQRLDDGPAVLPALAAAGAVLGHVYPIFLGFRGGKGVATGAGAFLAVAPFPSLLALVVFAVVLATTRYVSLGSMAGALAIPAALYALDAPSPLCRVGVLLALLIVFRHQENVARLLRGSERRLGSRP
jgi:glycerol-3-phosphate acyltransferase PlsY